MRKLERHPVLWFAIASAALVLLLYWPVFHSQFVYDDVTLIEKNAELQHWSTVLDYFRSATPFGGDFGGASSSYYRPVTWLSFALDRFIWGLNPGGYHFTNLLLHWANGLLGFVLLRRLGCSILLAGASVLLWLGLPVNSEAVAWISARTYTLLCLFLLLALLSAERYLRTTRWSSLALFFAACLAASFSHETGVLVLPLAAVALGWQTRSKHREWSLLAVAALAAAAFYYLARHFAGGTAPAIPGLPVAFGEYFLKYLSWMLFPLHMSMERSTDTPAAILSPAAITAGAIVVLLFAAMFVLRKKVPEAAAGLAWMCVATLPLCGFVFIYQGMAERYMYIPSAGLCFAIIALALSVPANVRTFVVTFVALWALWGAWRTYARATDWTNPVALFTSSLEADPRSWVLQLNVGNTYLQEGDATDAIQSYNAALRINPAAVKAMVNLASALQVSGNKSAAEQEYRRALQLDPKRSDIYCDLAVVLFEEDHVPEAEQLLQKAIALDANNETAWFDLGVLYARERKNSQAAAMYNRALAIDPNYADARRGLQVLNGLPR